MKKVLKKVSFLIFAIVAIFSVRNVSAAPANSVGPISVIWDTNKRNGVSFFPYKYAGSTAVICTKFQATTPNGVTCSISDSWNAAVKAGVGAIIKKANITNGSMTNEYYFAELATNLFLYEFAGCSDCWPYYGVGKDYLLTSTTGVSYKSYYDAAVTAYKKVKKGVSTELSLKSGSKSYVIDTEDKTSITNKYTLSGTADTYKLKITSSNAPSTVSFNIGNSKFSGHYTLGETKEVAAGDLDVNVTGLRPGESFSVKISITGQLDTSCYFATNYSCGDGYQTITPNVTVTGDCAEPDSVSASIKLVTVSEPDYPTIKVVKKDSNGNVLKGARFKFTKNGDTSYSSTGTTNDSGIINKDIIDEADTYCITETSAPNGYLLDNTKRCFTVKTTQSGSTYNVSVSNLSSGLTYDESSNVVTLTLTNKKNSVKIGKVNSSGELIAGATLRLENKYTNTVINEWVTTTDYLTLSGLEPGYYKLSEVKAPNGYKTTGKYKVFNVYKNQTMDSPITIKLPNEEITLNISKTDISGTDELPGANLKVCKQSDTNDETCTPIKTIHNVELNWTSTNVKKTFSGVPAGSYKLVETTAPDGYIKTESIDFEIDEYGVITRGGSSTSAIVMTNAQNELSVKKIDKDTQQVVIGAVLKITDSKGNTVKLNGNDLEWTTETTPKVIKGLPVGTYYIEEVSAPDGYVKSDEKIVFTIDEKGNVKQNGVLKEDLTLLVNNKQNELNVSKVDKDGKFIVGAVLKITDKDGKTVKLSGKELQWTTENKTKTIKGLPKGTYYLEEVSAPNGYAKSNEKIEFSVNSKGYITQKDVVKDSLTIMMTNALTKVYISKQDITSKEELPGATLQLYDGRNVLVEEWVSGEEPHFIEGLPTGQTYTLIETTAPDGYDKAESITFTINEDGTITGDTVMYDKLSTVKVEDTLLNRSILVIVFGGILVIGGIIISRKKDIKKMTKLK